MSIAPTTLALSNEPGDDNSEISDLGQITSGDANVFRGSRGSAVGSFLAPNSLTGRRLDRGAVRRSDRTSPRTDDAPAPGAGPARPAFSARKVEGLALGAAVRRAPGPEHSAGGASWRSHRNLLLRWRRAFSRV